MVVKKFIFVFLLLHSYCLGHEGHGDGGQSTDVYYSLLSDHSGINLRTIPKQLSNIGNKTRNIEGILHWLNQDWVDVSAGKKKEAFIASQSIIVLLRCFSEERRVLDALMRLLNEAQDSYDNPEIIYKTIDFYGAKFSNSDGFSDFVQKSFNDSGRKLLFFEQDLKKSRGDRGEEEFEQTNTLNVSGDSVEEGGSKRSWVRYLYYLLITALLAILFIFLKKKLWKWVFLFLSIVLCSMFLFDFLSEPFHANPKDRVVGSHSKTPFPPEGYRIGKRPLYFVDQIQKKSAGISTSSPQGEWLEKSLQSLNFVIELCESNNVADYSKIEVKLREVVKLLEGGIPENITAEAWGHYENLALSVILVAQHKTFSKVAIELLEGFRQRGENPDLCAALATQFFQMDVSRLKGFQSKKFRETITSCYVDVMRSSSSEKRVDLLVLAYNPLSPPAAPVQGRLQGPPAKSKFLAIINQIKDWSMNGDVIENARAFPAPGDRLLTSKRARGNSSPQSYDASTIGG